MDRTFNTIEQLEKLKKHTKRGVEYWSGRDIYLILGYASWDRFRDVIDRAVSACESSGVDSDHHFFNTAKVITAGKGAQLQKSDCFLSRYACYLVAMNGNPTKPEIGIAQTYFAVKTRRQELEEKRIDKLSDEEKRIQLRDRVRRSNRELASAAKNAGVQKYAIFQDAGYRGLYEMGVRDIKSRKGIPPGDDLLDRAGRAELAANEFRITQTEQKLVRQNIRGEDRAIDTHREVGQEVRCSIKRIGGTMPEDLAPETPIKKLLKKRKQKLIGPGDSTDDKRE